MTNNKQIKKLVKELAKIIYPDYKGRLFWFCEQKQYHMRNYWDEGSRYYCVAVDLNTGKILPPSHESSVPYNSSAHASFDIPKGVGILQHAIVCGSDRGITLYVAPNTDYINIEQPTALEGWQKAIEELT